MSRPPKPADLDQESAATPRRFADVVGQESAVRSLRCAVASGRLPHALIFSGPEGVGKATCAAILAAALNCRASPREACGVCRSCHKIARGLHPDVLTVVPDGRHIRMSQVLEICKQVAYRPYEGSCRVVVVDRAHAMNPSAQNAILKTLEEPPPSSMLILVTSAPGGLLPTVHSRCQELRFGPLPLPDVQRTLRDVCGMSADEARLRSRLEPGSLGRAIALDLDAHARALEIVVDAIRLASRGGAGVVAAAEALVDQGRGETATERAADTLDVARRVLRDLLVIASGAGSELLVHLEHRDAWKDWARSMRAEALADATHAVELGIERLTRGVQPNVKMSLEHTLARLSSALTSTRVPA